MYIILCLVFDNEKVLKIENNIQLKLSLPSETDTKEWTFSFWISYSSDTNFEVLAAKRFKLEIHDNHNHNKLSILQDSSIDKFENSILFPNTWLEFRLGASNSLQKAFFEIKNVTDQSKLFSSEKAINISMSPIEPSYIDFKEKKAKVSGSKIREIRLFGEYLPSINGNSSAPMSPHNFHKPLAYYRMNENYGNIVYDSAELGSKYTDTYSNTFEWVAETTDLQTARCQYPYQTIEDGVCATNAFKIGIFQPPPGNNGKYILWSEGEYKCYQDNGKFSSLEDPLCPSDQQNLDNSQDIAVIIQGQKFYTSSETDFHIIPFIQSNNYSSQSIYYKSDQLDEKIYKLDINAYQNSAEGGNTLLLASSRSIFIDLLPVTPDNVSNEEEEEEENTTSNNTHNQVGIIPQVYLSGTPPNCLFMNIYIYMYIDIFIYIFSL